jgi:hypothetical protein
LVVALLEVALAVALAVADSLVEVLVEIGKIRLQISASRLHIKNK